MVTVGGAASLKLAVTDLLPVIVIIIGLFVPSTSPLQPEKANPGFAIAVTATSVPLVYRAMFGSWLVVPPGPATVVNRHWPGRSSCAGISWLGFWNRKFTS